MKSLFKKYIWLQLILSILLLFGGALIIAFAATNKQNILEDALNIIAAVILFLFGLFAILTSFIFEPNKVFTNGLFYGSVCIALGVFLCIRELVLLNYLVLLLGVFFIVAGTVELVNGIILIAKKVKNVLYIVICFVAAVLFITGGILAIIYRGNVKIVFCIIAGVLIFAAGLYELIFGIREMIAQSKEKDKEKKPARRAKKEKQEPKKEEVKELDYTKHD